MQKYLSVLFVLSFIIFSDLCKVRHAHSEGQDPTDLYQPSRLCLNLNLPQPEGQDPTDLFQPSGLCLNLNLPQPDQMNVRCAHSEGQDPTDLYQPSTLCLNLNQPQPDQMNVRCHLYQPSRLCLNLNKCNSVGQASTSSIYILQGGWGPLVILTLNIVYKC